VLYPALPSAALSATNWKEKQRSNQALPAFLAAIFANGFKNPLGALAILYVGRTSVHNALTLVAVGHGGECLVRDVHGVRGNGATLYPPHPTPLIPSAPSGGFYAPLIAYTFGQWSTWAGERALEGSLLVAVAVYGTAVLLVAGKALAVVAELWFVRQYFTSLLDDDVGRASDRPK
jgi:hypothetical protein